MIDPEQAARTLNSYESVLKDNPNVREIAVGMPLVKDKKKALLKEIVQAGFTATLQNGKWQVRCS